MDFHEVEYDEADDMEADELRELVSAFSKAQRVNKDTFGDAIEQVEEFAEYETSVNAELTEESSLSESAVEALAFSEKKDLLDDLDATEADEEESEQQFKDRGTKGETHTEGDEEGPGEVVTEVFEDIPGVKL
jgi:hypothetical protein